MQMKAREKKQEQGRNGEFAALFFSSELKREQQNTYTDMDTVRYILVWIRFTHQGKQTHHVLLKFN